MKQSDLEALLGRSLTPTEVNNLNLYLDIAKSSLESLLCMSLDVQSGDTTAAERTFESREGYSTVFTDIFTEVESITVGGKTVTSYHPAFWDDRNADFYNSIVFDDCPHGDVVVTAKWGFSELPNDLQKLWAQLFANTSKKYATGSVKSKQVEDFRITYGDLTDDETFMSANQRVIQKYGMCGIGDIRQGKVHGC